MTEEPHRNENRVIDPDLLAHDVLWDAAGTWHDVFSLTPHQPVADSGGNVTEPGRS